MNQTGRVERLERLEPVRAGPSYVVVDSLDDLEGLDLVEPVKVYVGVSPDDWPEPVRAADVAGGQAGSV